MFDAMFHRGRAALVAAGGAALMAMPSVHAASQPTPAGMWRAVDDASGAPVAEVQILETDGILTGRIGKNLQPATEPGPEVCAKCPAELHGAPINGLPIIRDLRPDHDATTWSGGQILDPETGKSYRLKVQLRDNGKTMQVRGYLGPFYREQLWYRVSD